MGKIRLVVSVDCDSIEVAQRVQAESLPDLTALLQSDGITAVRAEWLAEREID